MELDRPPVVQVTEDIVAASKQLQSTDVGRWAVVLPDNHISLCDSKRDAEELQDYLTKVKPS